MFAAMARGNPAFPSISANEWMGLLDAQVATRREWASLFESFDVVLAPVHGTAAFPHDDSPDPMATAIPMSQTRTGLPIGAQVIGPYLEDRTTIGFAALVEREFGRFKAPPGY